VPLPFRMQGFPQLTVGPQTAVQSPKAKADEGKSPQSNSRTIAPSFIVFITETPFLGVIAMGAVDHSGAGRRYQFIARA